ncbi:hypothetical protein MNV49_000308 [Pseudohyphozyma bogoriensis]|nr:hypothetical protein MNV49_000308 [Pseudohyphozyma bogoriensis]
MAAPTASDAPYISLQPVDKDDDGSVSSEDDGLSRAAAATRTLRRPFVDVAGGRLSDEWLARGRRIVRLALPAVVAVGLLVLSCWGVSTYIGNSQSYDSMLREVMRYPHQPQDSFESQLVEGVELLYLAKRTNKIAIVMSISGIWPAGSNLNFSDIYDLPRFYALTRVPAVPISSFKTRHSETSRPETLPCWSLFEQYRGGGNFEHFGHHKIFTAMWAMPHFARTQTSHHAIQFEEVIDFVSSRKRQETWLEEVREGWLPQKNVAAGTQVDLADNVKDGFDPQSQETPINISVTCLDSTFYLAYDAVGEVGHHRVNAPEWKEIGRHLRFTPRIEEVKEKYLRRIFGVDKRDEVPMYISIHIRRGDFKDFKGGSILPLSSYETSVRDVRRKLLRRTQLKDPTAPLFTLSPYHWPVLVTTDEPGTSDFVRDVKALGWKVVDHDELNTTAELGDWWGPVLDSAMLAGGHGFVGTMRSTFSLLAGLRVESWNNGEAVVAQKES